MNGFLEIDAKEIEVLKGDGGIPFRDFMKSLLRAHACALGIADINIVCDSENMKDGGCDAEVKVAAASDTTGYMSNPTCWQFKGTDKSSVTEAQMRKEINKPYVNQLICKGFEYRLCIADDLPAQDITDREKFLLEEVVQINPNAPKPRVLGSTTIAAWANLYPALAFTQKGTVGLQTLKSWGHSITSVTKEYVQYAEWLPIEHLINKHINFANEAGTACVTIRGAAGVGKTRFIYEIINRHPNARNLCLYTADEKAALNIAYALSNSQDRMAILVADECLNRIRHQIEETLAGVKSRVRVIVINNTDEPTYSLAPEPQLERLSQEVLEIILEKNFPSVPPELRKAALQLSEGFVRIAADLCLHGIEKGVQQLGSYVKMRLTDATRLQAVEAISLFERVGFKDEFAGELKNLSQITEIKEVDLRRCCIEIKDSPGFIGMGGRFFYVTPEAVAQVCFESAWAKWVDHDIKGFYNSLTPSLKESFQSRLRKSASKEVREKFANALEKIASDVKAGDLVDKKKISEFLELVEINPSRFLNRLRILIEEAPSDVLMQVSGGFNHGWGLRRKTVWLCEHLALFPEYFYDVESILLRLALHETEEKIANNATSIWKQLFRLYLPGTAVPFSDRITLLVKRISSSDEKTALLAVDALAGLFEDNVMRMGSPPVVAGRIPPHDWHPKTVQEQSECFQIGFAAIKGALSDVRPNVQERTIQLILLNLRFLLRLGFIDFSKDAITSSPFRSSYLPRILDRIEEFRSFDGDRFPPDYLKKVVDWRDSLISDNDVLERVRSIIGRERTWNNDSEDRKQFPSKIAEIAQGFLTNNPDFKRCLPWLSSAEANHAFELGEELGKIDANYTLFELIKPFANPTSAALIRGYIYGVSNKLVSLPPQIVEWLDEIEQSSPELSYFISITVPDQVDGFDRVMRLFEGGKIRAGYLEGIQYRLGPNGFNRERMLRVVKSLLDQIGKSSDEALITALHVASGWIDDQAQAKRPIGLDDTELWGVLRSIVEQVEPKRTMDTYHWGRLARAVSKIDFEMVVKKCVEALNGDIYTGEEAGRILIELVSMNPKCIMTELGSLILDRNKGLRLEIRGYTELLSGLPVDVVCDWLKEHGIIAARRIAANLPRPQLDESGQPFIPELTRKVLEFYGDDKDVQRRFASPSGIRSYSGDIAKQHLEEADFAKNFLTHHLEAVRIWAQVESQSAEKQAEWWQQKEEEERF